MSIKTELDTLPQSGVTVYALNALDYAVPGEWENVTGFENMIRHVAGKKNPAQVQQIAKRAMKIYNDPNSGYQRALQVYTMVDKADAALGAAAMANKVGQRISFLSFLSRLTPKADTTQAIDLGVKIVAELVAFTSINGMPTDRGSIGAFTSALVNQYRGESLMRMVALVAFDGVVPLGPDFTRKVTSILGGLDTSQLQSNAAFKQINQWIPGGSTAGQLGFITDSFTSVQGWMDNILQSRDLSPDRILSSLRQYIDFSDDKLDYLAAFLDMSTTYFSHTGTQSVAHHLIERTAKG